MPVNPFSNKKLLRELQEQRDLLLARQQQEEETQRWKEEQLQDQQRQLHDQLARAERQLEQERQLHIQLARTERQLEQERQVREQERQTLARQREKERRERERLENERVQKERERKEREQRRLERLKLTSPEALRGLRDLIRTRYALDMEIWSLKGARKPNRPVVEEKMGRADAILMEIYNMVETWEENDKVWTPQEWELARDVKKRILEKGKRQWKDNPPWNEN
jgi:hypothetical protein